jgi:hypothetical protein
VSQRKGVKIPGGQHAEGIPDWNNMGQYLRTSVAESAPLQKQITDMYAQIKNR